MMRNFTLREVPLHNSVNNAHSEQAHDSAHASVIGGILACVIALPFIYKDILNNSQSQNVQTAFSLFCGCRMFVL